MACAVYPNNILLPIKPGAFSETTAAFLSFLPIAIIVANVSSDVASPRTTSNSLIIFAGLKKWVPTTISGLLVTDAIESISKPDVLLASIAPSLTCSSKDLKISCLSSKFSYTASITMSQSETSL